MFALSGNAYTGQKTLKEPTSTLVEVGSPSSDDTPLALRNDQHILEDSKTSTIEPSLTGSDVVPDPLLEDLERVMADITLKDEPADKEVDRATLLVQASLFKQEAEFQRVMVYRDRGWNHNKDKGDTFFKAQRENADKADDEGEQRFYKMMIKIAHDLDSTTEALHPPVLAGRNIKVMDICMAPGGYSAAVLQMHPGAEIFGLTLPKNEGGHSMVLPINKLRGIKYADVTMLASEMLKGTDKTVPKSYPDSAKFNPLRPFVSHKMDLVFLDGIVLRTHERASYRQQNEPLRLSTAQLVLGMQRLTQGGTLVMLMHKVDSWASVNVIYTFSKFATLHLFKPKSAHATRSSFYLVARNVDVESPLAAAAVAEWKNKWYNATFGGPVGTGGDVPEPEDTVVLGILRTFGERLIQMGIPLWKIQADALAKSVYAGDVPSAPGRKKESQSEV
ncbi:hypothetical protein D0Z07_3592 [Hyphodiscus hymeniophilus]|uniref:Ribosomal RNA methyltransferase FtsJ domain-containing protein n=1 Tax=Hyphodiscus hymeniophilus TaxID=353542 RepID=A0A9P6VKL5_9HELO|nr:hypothetical protein D0Z07_3592 [Hyphodiscus hymeniophilus]